MTAVMAAAPAPATENRSIAALGILFRDFRIWSQSGGDGAVMSLKFNHRST